MAITFDVDGIPVRAGTGAGKILPIVASIAALKARDITDANTSNAAGDMVFVKGYHSGSSIGGGLFIIIDDAGESDDGGHIIEPTVASGNLKYARMGIDRMTGNVVNFGAKGDLSTDDTAAIQACVDSVEAACFNSGGSDVSKYPYGGTIHFPPANPGYKITAPIRIPSTIFGSRVIGPAFIKQFTTTGSNSRIFQYSADVDGSGFPANNFRTSVLEGFAFDWDGGSSDADAVAIYFENASIDAGHLVEGMVIRNCYCREGNHFVKQGTATGSYVSQLTIQDCFTQSMSSSAIYMNQGSIGNTSIQISNIRTGSSTSDPTIHLDGYHSFSIDNCSFESNDGGLCPTFVFENCQGACSFHNNRTEWGDANGESIFTITGGASRIAFHNNEFRHWVLDANEDVTLFNVDGGKIFVYGFTIIEQCTTASTSNDLTIFDLASGTTAYFDGFYESINGTGTLGITQKTGAGTLVDRTV